MKCEICNTNFNNFKSLGVHIARRHKIETENYYLKFINSIRGSCKLCNAPTRFVNIAKGYSRCCGFRCSKLLDNKNPEYRKKISDATKRAMWRPEIRKKFLDAISIPKSKETLKKMSESARQRFVDDPTLKTRIYTKKRNKKISNSKIEFWKHNPEEKKRVGNIWKMWKARDECGWRKHLMEASKRGFEKIFSPLGDTSLETKLYKMLLKEGIKFQKKYELEGKIFDAYLPEFATLIEIDGDFWHRPTLEECKYTFQIESFHNDRLKENIAKNKNLKLIRIKEKEIPTTIGEIL